MARHSHLNLFQNGMTVLEVIVSLAIAGVFLAAMLPSTVQAYARFKRAELQYRATDLAKAKAEEVSQTAGRDSFPKEGKEDGLMWRIDAETSEKRRDSPSAGRPSLRTYTISVLSDGRDPLMEFVIQRLYTER